MPISINTSILLSTHNLHSPVVSQTHPVVTQCCTHCSYSRLRSSSYNSCSNSCSIPLIQDNAECVLSTVSTCESTISTHGDDSGHPVTSRGITADAVTRHHSSGSLCHYHHHHPCDHVPYHCHDFVAPTAPLQISCRTWTVKWQSHSMSPPLSAQIRLLPLTSTALNGFTFCHPRQALRTSSEQDPGLHGLPLFSNMAVTMTIHRYRDIPRLADHSHGQWISRCHQPVRQIHTPFCVDWFIWRPFPPRRNGKKRHRNHLRGEPPPSRDNLQDVLNNWVKEFQYGAPRAKCKTTDQSAEGSICNINHFRSNEKCFPMPHFKGSLTVAVKVW